MQLSALHGYVVSILVCSQFTHRHIEHLDRRRLLVQFVQCVGTRSGQDTYHSVQSTPETGAHGNVDE